MLRWAQWVQVNMEVVQKPSDPLQLVHIFVSLLQAGLDDAGFSVSEWCGHILSFGEHFPKGSNDNVVRLPWHPPQPTPNTTLEMEAEEGARLLSFGTWFDLRSILWIQLSLWCQATRHTKCVPKS